jgi:AhpD family alkylhydroperoxidase
MRLSGKKLVRLSGKQLFAVPSPRATMKVLKFSRTNQSDLRLQGVFGMRSSGKGTLPMDEFDRYRTEMNEKLLGSNHLGIKRFFALDTQAYEDGALDKRTKELLGLVASTVLRCDDCITYHIKQCVNVGVTRPELLDAFNVALVVGGSITIPHLRRAIDRLDQMLQTNGDGDGGSIQAHEH